MRDLASCFGDHAVEVSDSSCSGAPRNVPCVQNTVTNFYKTNLSPQKEVVIAVTWCINLMGHAVSVSLNDDASCISKVDTNSWQFLKKKGSRSLGIHDTKVEVHWDLSCAKYSHGPEPIKAFYLLFLTKPGTRLLLLGDMEDEAASIRKLNITSQDPFSFLVARKEYVSGNDLYSTKSRFIHRGVSHEILIKCNGGQGGGKEPELFVSIDKKRVVHVKKLQWKFRGNETIFVDGVPIDMMWDVHDWLHSPTALATGDVVFMFRSRNGLEEKLVDEKDVVFSLLIYACKSP